jgi:hypothetical protein
MLQYLAQQVEMARLIFLARFIQGWVWIKQGIV